MSLSFPAAGFRPAVLAVAAAVLTASGCSLDAGIPSGSGSRAGSPSPAASGPASGTSSARPGSALAAAGGLTVKGRAPKTGYARDRFGSSWVDTDDNGCGTRDDILKRDLRAETFRSGGCEVTSGTLDDPYTGGRLSFVRGHSVVDIDHAVALADAWQKGAQQWPRTTRVAFANDPLNLLAVSASANRSKGDGDTATWLPPDKPFRCRYVARQVAVKQKYGVWVTRAEKDAMVRVLTGCPDQKLPAAADPVR